MIVSESGEIESASDMADTRGTPNLAITIPSHQAGPPKDSAGLQEGNMTPATRLRFLRIIYWLLA